jgi:cysteine-rich repeat protein
MTVPMTNRGRFGRASALSAWSFFVATLGALVLLPGWGCSNASIVSQGGQGGDGGNHAGGGGSGGFNGNITLTSSVPLADAGTKNKTCTADAGKCYAMVDAGPYCGDGIVQAERGETCDDGNRIGGDGCSGTCKIEPNYRCPAEGQPCISTVACGNGIREPGESCDDNNANSGDGCSSTCSVELGWLCPVAGESCKRVETCGDGRLQSGEQCDLGSANGTNVGCDAHCVLQPGWTCKGHTCQIVPVCGDGQVTGGEQCDEGSMSSGTGCCENCKVTASYCSCPSSGGPCQDNSRCGNGVLEKNELCDDGNNKDGNGKKEAGETCDDGNTLPYDGCASNCQSEPKCGTSHQRGGCLQEHVRRRHPLARHRGLRRWQRGRWRRLLARLQDRSGLDLQVLLR